MVIGDDDDESSDDDDEVDVDDDDGVLVELTCEVEVAEPSTGSFPAAIWM